MALPFQPRLFRRDQARLSRQPLLLRIVPPSRIDAALREISNIQSAYIAPAQPMNQEDDDSAAHDAARIPVVLLHGTIDSPGSWSPLAQELHKRGRTVIIPAYGNRGTAAIADSARSLSDFIAEVLRQTSASAIDIVGHSQGGLIAYCIVQQMILDRSSPLHDAYCAAPSASPLRSVISISGSTKGAPWPRPLTLFSKMGSWLPTALGGTAMADQIELARNNETLHVPAPLADFPPEKLPTWINIISVGDRIVPTSSALTDDDYPGATTITTEEALGRSIMHWLQQRDRGVVKLVSQLLESIEKEKPR